MKNLNRKTDKTPFFYKPACLQINFDGRLLSIRVFFADGHYALIVVVYHLLGETGWSTVVVNGTRQIPNRNFHGDALVPLPRLFPGR